MPACWVVRAGRRTRPTVEGCDGEFACRHLADAVRPGDSGVGDRITAVWRTYEVGHHVGAVGEVDGEPVPTADAGRNEVAPLVVEPGRAMDRQQHPVVGQAAGGSHTRARVVVRAGDAVVDPAI